MLGWSDASLAVFLFSLIIVNVHAAWRTLPDADLDTFFSPREVCLLKQGFTPRTTHANLTQKCLEYQYSPNCEEGTSHMCAAMDPTSFKMRWFEDDTATQRHTPETMEDPMKQLLGSNIRTIHFYGDSTMTNHPAFGGFACSNSDNCQNRACFTLHEFASPGDLLNGRFKNNTELAKLRVLMDGFQQGTVHIVQWKVPMVLKDENQFASIVHLLNITTSRNDGSRTAHVFNQGLHVRDHDSLGQFSLYAKRFQVLVDIVNARGDIAAWRETFPQHFSGSDKSGMYERRFQQLQQWGVTVSPNAAPCDRVDSMCTCDVQRAAGDHQSFDEALAREMTTARFIPMFDLLHARGDLHFTRRFLKGGNLMEPDCTHYCRSPLLLDAIVRRTVGVLITG